MKSTIEETQSLISCEPFGDSIRANVSVPGEDLPFLLKAEKNPNS